MSSAAVGTKQYCIALYMPHTRVCSAAGCCSPNQFKPQPWLPLLTGVAAVGDLQAIEALQKHKQDFKLPALLMHATGDKITDNKVSGSMFLLWFQASG